MTPIDTVDIYENAYEFWVQAYMNLDCFLSDTQEGKTNFGWLKANSDALDDSGYVIGPDWVFNRNDQKITYLESWDGNQNNKQNNCKLAIRIDGAEPLNSNIKIGNNEKIAGEQVYESLEATLIVQNIINQFTSPMIMKTQVESKRHR